jgi:pimeloyl-ACP methyl ester carboxylesterase
MNRKVSTRFQGGRLSRRSAIGKLVGTGAAAAVAAAGLGMSRGATLGASSRVRSSVVTTKKGITMTEASPTANSTPLTVALVHGAFADASGWNGVIERLQAAGITVTCPPNPLRGITHDAAYVASFLNQIPGPVLLVGHSYGGAVITNAGSRVKNAVGLVYVAGFAPDEGQTLLDIEKGSRDSVLLSALVPLQYPTGNGMETATEFAIKPDKVQEAFAADLPQNQAALLAATQRPIAELTFAEKTTAPAWKTLPTWAVVPTGDKTIGSDAVRSMAERAKATIVEVEGSHVIMISQPQAVTDVIMTAIDTVS